MFLRIDGQPAKHKLPNALREAMLQAKVEKSLVILEGFYMLGVAHDEWLTFDQILRFCQGNYGMSRQLVYHGLVNEQVFQRRKAEAEPGKRGAPFYLYRIPHPDELIAEFAPDLPHSPHDELEKKDLKNVSAYRKGLHGAMYRRLWLENGGKGFQMSRKLMAERLGVSARTVRTYDKELGFSNEPNYKEVEITENTWGKLPRFKDKFDKNGKRLPSKTWLKILIPHQGYVNVPFVRYLAYKALQAGHYVWQVERKTNTYYPYLKPDPKQFDRQDVLGYYYAEKEARKEAGFYQNRDGLWSFCGKEYFPESPCDSYSYGA